MLPFFACIRRETVTTLRSKGAMALVGLVVLGTVAVQILTWPGDDVTLSMQADVSVVLFSEVAAAFVLAIVLFIPALLGGAVVLERERETLEMLTTTCLRPLPYVLAKMISTSSVVVLVVLACSPLLVSPYMLAGLDAATVVTTFALLFALAFSVSSASIFFSCYARTPATAIAGAYAAMLVLNGFPAVVLVLAGEAADYDALMYAMEAVLEWTAPVFILIFALVEYRIFVDSVVVCCLVHVGLGIALLAASYWKVRRYWMPRAKRTRFHLKSVSSKRFYRWPQPRLSFRWSGMNPVFVKDVVYDLRLSAWPGLRLFALTVAVALSASLFLVMIASYDVHSGYKEGLHGWLTLQPVLMAFVLPGYAASRMTGEHAKQTMDGLRMSLLKSHEIFFGKLLAGLAVLGLFTAAVVVSAAPYAAKGYSFEGEWLLLASAMTTFVVVGFVVVTVALWVAVRTRSLPLALVISYFLLFMILGGNYAVAEFVRDEYLQRHTYRNVYRGAADPVLYFSPLAAFFTLADAVRYRRFDYGGVEVWGFVMALYTMLSTALIAWAGWTFHRRVYRER